MYSMSICQSMFKIILSMTDLFVLICVFWRIVALAKMQLCDTNNAMHWHDRHDPISHFFWLTLDALTHLRKLCAVPNNIVFFDITYVLCCPLVVAIVAVIVLLLIRFDL